MQQFPLVSLDALLTPENCAVLLIDHQPFQLANVNSHDPTMVINNVTALARTAKAYGIPTKFSWVQHFERERYDTQSNDLTEPPLPGQT